MEVHKCIAWRLCLSGVSALVCCLFFGTLALFLALVGVTAGAIIGTLIGLKSESTVFKKAAIGAVAGGVLSIEIFRVSLCFFLPVNSGLSWFFPLFDSAKDCIARKMVAEWRHDPAAIAGDTMTADVSRRYSEEKIPSTKIAKKDLLDSSGSQVCCSICLQDFKFREMVRRVPCCRQAFHPACIDKWLTGHNSCPLCRSKILN